MTGEVRKAPCRFILQALDPLLRGPALEALFRVEALDDLRVLLRSEAEEDPKLHRLYYPDAGELQAIIGRFDVAFDPGERTTRLYNLEIRGRLPYLPHAGYELPLLLDGTKQFGFLDNFYPPHRHDSEELFDHHVADGQLCKEIVLEPFDDPVHQKDGRTLEGFRRVYYTRSGEEWRIPAHKLLWSTRQPWDATHERLWSMLFGYEEWQTDYWITYNCERSGAWSGVPVYCSVDVAQLEAVEAVGFRAFPPVGGAPLIFGETRERPTRDEALGLMTPDAVAVVRANVAGLFLWEIKRGQPGPSHSIAAEHLPEFNRNIIGMLELIARRS